MEQETVVFNGDLYTVVEMYPSGYLEMVKNNNRYHRVFAHESKVETIANE